MRVTGYRNCVRIAFPVFEDSADVVYHKIHKSTKTEVEDAGAAVVNEGLGDKGRDRLVREGQLGQLCWMKVFMLAR